MLTLGVSNAYTKQGDQIWKSDQYNSLYEDNDERLEGLRTLVAVRPRGFFPRSLVIGLAKPRLAMSA